MTDICRATASHVAAATLAGICGMIAGVEARASPAVQLRAAANDAR